MTSIRERPIVHHRSGRATPAPGVDTFEEQVAKLALIVSVADEVWG